jgi:hypothetical protein
MIKKPYYHIQSTITVMNRLLRESAVDGFEIQHLAEWNKNSPPRDDLTGERAAAWKNSEKYTTQEIAAFLEGLPILSVHANRDVGIYLCSDSEQDINTGKELIHESLQLAETVGADVCVIHLWDTWKKNFDMNGLQNVLHEVASQYSVKASVENVPTHLEGTTPFELVKECEWVTLDMRWAAMYDELEKFESVIARIVNIHLRGHLEGRTWVLADAPFTFDEALHRIKTWGYTGLVTMEPEGLRGSSWDNIAAAMASLL